jgi:NADH-quinone oxidoreductase subunit N
MNIDFPVANWSVIGPEMALTITAMGLLLITAFSKKLNKWIPYLALAGFVFALFSIFPYWDKPQYGFHQMVVMDNYSLFFKFLFVAAAFLVVLMSIRYVEREGFDHGEYYVLVLFATVGMMLMAGAADLLVVFLGLETFSLAIYVLAGFFRTQPKSNESALKYFLLGAFATGFLLYGIALIYGATGSTNLKKIAELFSQTAMLKNPMLLVGMGLLLVGFSFKVAAVPFHMWTPDVYEGAPTAITAFMSVGPKAAGFAAFIRVFLNVFPTMAADWVWILWVLAVLTMTLGNLVAIAQKNIKRMLAYSSIAHAGYMLVAMVAASEFGTASILYYLLAYTFMNLGAFGVVILYGRKGEENALISDYSGMASQYPLLAATMAVFMFSLAGIPPTAGFVGKFYIFSAAISSGYLGLAIIGVLNSVLSVYFYLRVTVMMYMKGPEKEMGKRDICPALVVAILITAIATLQMGITPSVYLNMVRQALVLLQ